VPHRLQAPIAERQVPRPRERGALDLTGQRSAPRAGPRAFLGRDQVHPPGAIFQSLHRSDGQAVEVEQQRRIVVQARGPMMIELRREQQ